MAEKIDQIKCGNVVYDIDLPPDATPDINKLTSKNLKLTNVSSNASDKALVLDSSNEVKYTTLPQVLRLL